MKRARFLYLLLYLVCYAIVFWLKYMKKIQLHTNIWGENRIILITFQVSVDILWCYYTKTWQVLNCYRLVATWKLKPNMWTFFVATLKFTSLFYTLSEPFTYVWYSNIIHWSFVKYWITEFCKYSLYWHISLYNI